MKTQIFWSFQQRQRHPLTQNLIYQTFLIPQIHHCLAVEGEDADVDEVAAVARLGNKLH